MFGLILVFLLSLRELQNQAGALSIDGATHPRLLVVAFSHTK
jgi:hypothetical protein